MTKLTVRNENGHSVRITDAGLAKIEELASKSFAEGTIAKALGMSPGTFRTKKQNYPEVAEVLELGRAVHHDRLIAKLDEFVDNNNVTATIFGLKSIHGYRDMGPATAEDHKTQINIQIVAPMSKEEADELVIDHNPTD